MFFEQENIFFQDEDALCGWDFISEEIKEEIEVESFAKIFVKMNKEIKIIHLYKSTLTLEYSISDLIKKIRKEFKLTNDKSLKLFYDNRILVSNDLVLRQILDNLRQIPLELDVLVIDNKHCLLCMKSNCYHNSKVLNGEKKRKMENKSEINFLEPEITNVHPKQNNSTISFSAKKRRISCCSQSLKSSQKLLIPSNNNNNNIGSFIF